MNVSFVDAALAPYLIQPLASLVLDYWVPFCFRSPKIRKIKQLELPCDKFHSCVPSQDGFFFLEEGRNHSVLICCTRTNNEKFETSWKEQQIFWGLIHQTEQECKTENTVAWMTSMRGHIAVEFHVMDPQRRELKYEMIFPMSWWEFDQMQHHPDLRCITLGKIYPPTVIRYNFESGHIVASRAEPQDVDFFSPRIPISLVSGATKKRKRNQKRGSIRKRVSFLRIDFDRKRVSFLRIDFPGGSGCSIDCNDVSSNTNQRISHDRRRRRISYC